MGKRGPKPRVDVAKLRRLLTVNKLSVPEAARRLGCARSTVYGLARQHHIDVPPPPRRIDAEKRTAWIEALSTEPSLAAAGKRMGRTRQAASQMAAVLVAEGVIEYAEEG